MRIHIFSKLRESRLSRLFCAFMALNLIAEIVSPTVAMALTAGPAAPEFSSFEPVATTDMVNEFTGDFTYNIPILNLPGPDGGGYSMSLAYHSGASSQEESSWVGFGWTLNPGAINRNKRGYADEFKNVKVMNYNQLKPNYTETSKFDFNVEFNSKDLGQRDRKKQAEASAKALDMARKLLLSSLPSGVPGIPDASGSGGESDSGPADISLSLSHTIRYNNYSGFSIANGIGVGVFGAGNMSMNRSGGQNTYGFSVNPMAIYKIGAKMWKENKHASDKNFNANPATGNDNQIGSKNAFKDVTKVTNVKTFVKAMGQVAAITAKGNLSRATSSWYTFVSHGAPAVPYSVAKTRAFAWNYSGSVQFNPTGPLGFQLGIAGHMNLSATEGEEERSAYGYMFSGRNNANSEEGVVHDFQLEKETTFNRQDNNLAVPFNNADYFSATGGGIMGGFRLRHNTIGVYYPNKMENVMKIRQLGTEWGIGGTMSFGIDIGIGRQKTKVDGKWKKYSTPSGNMPSFSTALPEMRFLNDNGGEVDYNNNYDSDVFSYARVDKLGGVGGEKRLTLDNSTDLSMNKTKSTTSSNIYYDFYTDPADTNKNYITGVHVTNQDGNMFHYAQPVYTRNETALSIRLDDNADGTYLATHSLHHDFPLDNQNVTGTKTEEQYAGSFLMTSNTNFNYVDADNMYGPSDGDFGGWTRFGYRQAYGGNAGGGVWYRFRSPYNGLMYNGGRMVDKHDQMGSMSSGEKEVYYLKSIESKSHIAFFVTNKTSASTFSVDFPIAQYPSLYSNGQPISTVTVNLSGSGVERLDGVDAAAVTSGFDRAAESLTAIGDHHPHKLERVVLFSKNDLSKPVTTTFFEYDYTLCQQVPNNDWRIATPGSQGKLTLRKVWTESNGVLRSQIAPYQFHYDYYNKYEQSIVDKYPWAGEYNSASLLQNPFYEAEQLDAWGNYREDGKNRVKQEKFFVSQKASSAVFDPAAWQLKRIQLPSGGEIHVHYEQKDYVTVQDRRAMAMVSLVDDDVANNSYYTKDNGSKSNSEYRINPSDLNVATASVDEYTALLKRYFVNYRNKLYFKALYSFRKDKAPDINNGEDFSQYVTGYTTVNDVVQDGNSIVLKLGDTHDGKDKDDKTLPRWVCYQELLTNGGKNLGPNGESYKDDDFTSGVYAKSPIDTDTIKKIARKRIRTAVLGMFSDWVTLQVKNTLKVNACKQLEYENSYFRLPVFHAKKGGGGASV